jgi:Protein of unknown function (DUF1573)
MKPWFILIGLAVTITAVATVALPYIQDNSVDRGQLYLAPTKPAGPSSVVFVEGGLSYDFGVLPQQHKGSHTWIVKNTGAGPLELRGSSTTCSCTTSDLFVEEPDGRKVGKLVMIQPGESRSVGVSFDTKTWNDFHQSVTIATNDPEHPQIVLLVEGKVRPAISTYPADPSISFPAVSNEEPTMRRTFLYSSDKPDLKLIRLVSSNPALIGVESRPMTPEELAGLKIEKGYAIDTTVKPSANLGDFAEEVLVETDHPMKQEHRYKVRGTIIGPISVVPTKVTMRDATSSNGGTQDLTLWARGRTAVNFIVEKKPPGIDVAIEPIPTVAGLKGSKYKMTVKLVPGIESGQLRDEIHLKTDDPKVNELRVPVDILIQGAR